METYVIKSEDGFVVKRKWREYSQHYNYYYSDNVEDAILLNLDTANVWLEDISSDEPTYNITIQLVHVELKEYSKETNSLCKKVISKLGDRYIKSVHFGKYNGDLIGFKYSDSLQYAQTFYVNSPLFEQVLATADANELSFFEINYMMEEI